MVMTSRMQGIQDRLIDNGRKNVQKGVPEVSSIPSESKASDSLFVPEEKPRDILQTMILLALNNPKLGYHIYGGTVGEETIVKRRARGKMQRASRKRNRRVA